MPTSPGESVSDLVGAAAAQMHASTTSVKLHTDQAALELPDRTSQFSTDHLPIGQGERPSSRQTKAPIRPDEKMAELLGDKQSEWEKLSAKAPLQLLDLPVDILREIVKEITHTNDLTSLALTHSALHNLAISHIYSRFDIVWPDNHATSDNRTGVDALTYGLATLVMGEEVFGEAPNQQKNYYDCHTCMHCSHQCKSQPQSTPDQPRHALSGRLKRRGNYFAQFTRKFSLGNGPVDWVQEYLITKEGGKMLGTLVALAVARMKNLEAFIWDMPTGVLRDVWMALSSLGDAHNGQDCRLERLWIRWHDNSEAPLLSALPMANSASGNVTSLLAPPPGTGPLSLQQYRRVEQPSFSILPPLKSLSVLDIDEISYLEEMGILIHRSKDRLRELRVGIAQHASANSWVRVGNSSASSQVGLSDLNRFAGVLGILLSSVCDWNARNLRHTGTLREMPAQPNLKLYASANAQEAQAAATSHDATIPAAASIAVPGSNSFSGGPTSPKVTAPSTSGTLSNLSAQGAQEVAEHTEPGAETQSRREITATPQRTVGNRLSQFRQGREAEKLALDLLELERVPLSVEVMLKAFDWTKLTSLTILKCQNHDQLWRALRRKYTPVAYQPRPASMRNSKHFSTPHKPAALSATGPKDFLLNLKRIHTDSVTSSLVSFLDQSLAPNTLEWMFLQEGRPHVSTVSIDSIYKGPIRRHRNSLKKLLIDSEDRSDEGHPASNSRWRKWLFSRELLWFLTSGKMPSLRELGMALDYKDWHFFLQHLPQIPHLRSLYIPYVAGHVHGRNLDSRELALQILDIITLRPDLEICYMGIQSKCFEILETKVGERRGNKGNNTAGSTAGQAGGGSNFNNDGTYGGHGPHSTSGESEDAEDEDMEDDDDDDTHDAGAEESDTESDDNNHVGLGNPAPTLNHNVATFDSSSSDEGDGNDDDDDDDEAQHNGTNDDGDDLYGSEYFYEDEDDLDDDGDDGEGGGKGGRWGGRAGATVLKLREILFYDDKVSIFKARHGRL